MLRILLYAVPLVLAVYALVDLVQSGRIEPGSRVLYAHLGGQPALNAYAGAF